MSSSQSMKKVAAVSFAFALGAAAGFALGPTAAAPAVSVGEKADSGGAAATAARGVAPTSEARSAVAGPEPSTRLVAKARGERTPSPTDASGLSANARKYLVTMLKRSCDSLRDEYYVGVIGHTATRCAKSADDLASLDVSALSDEERAEHEEYIAALREYAAVCERFVACAKDEGSSVKEMVEAIILRNEASVRLDEAWEQERRAAFALLALQHGMSREDAVCFSQDMFDIASVCDSATPILAGWKDMAPVRKSYVAACELLREQMESEAEALK